MRLSLPSTPTVHVFGRTEDRQPDAAACACGQTLGPDAVQLRAGDERTWKCGACFAALQEEWEGQRVKRVRDFLRSGTVPA